MSITYPIGSEFHSHSWEVWIAIYLFLGGISAGAFIVAAISDLMGKDDFRGLAKASALLAPWPVMLGLGALIIDLGRPLTFWMLLFNYSLSSVMSIGVVILLVFQPISLLYAYMWWRPTTSSRRHLVAWAGILSAVAIGVYTGVLISVIATNPVWGSPLLPALFLVSAVSTGIAYALLGSRFIAPVETASKSLWGRIDVFLIGVELLLIGLLVIGWASSPVAGRALSELVTGGYAPLFWIGLIGVGLVIPLVVNLWEWARGHDALSPAVVTASYVFVLAGGFILRYVILNAGQSAGVTL